MTVTVHNDKVNLLTLKYHLFIIAIEIFYNFTLLFSSILAYENMIYFSVLYFRKILRFF